MQGTGVLQGKGTGVIAGSDCRDQRTVHEGRGGTSVRGGSQHAMCHCATQPGPSQSSISLPATHHPRPQPLHRVSSPVVVTTRVWTSTALSLSASTRSRSVPPAASISAGVKSRALATEAISDLVSSGLRLAARTAGRGVRFFFGKALVSQPLGPRSGTAHQMRQEG